MNPISTVTAQPAGLWGSPVCARSLSLSVRPSDVAWDSGGKTLIWHEHRGERGVLCACALDGNAHRDLNGEISVRARLGYGGGDFTAGFGKVCFASGGRLLLQSINGGPARPVTPPCGQAASPVFMPDGRHILYVYSLEGEDCLALADLSGTQWPVKVASGRDFYMQPRVSPCGKWVAWVAWDHPNMPWDGTHLYLAKITRDASGRIEFTEARSIAGGHDTAVFQPEFSPDANKLSYLCDEDGWHALYLYDLSSGNVEQLSCTEGVQLGAPAWAQGQRTHAWSHDSRMIVSVRNEKGFSSLLLWDMLNGKTAQLPGLEEYTDFQQPVFNPADNRLAFVASSPQHPARVVVHEVRAADAVQKAEKTIIVRRSAPANIRVDDLVKAHAVSWKGFDGGETHGLLYASNRLGSEPAPAIVRIHGGPTSQARAAYSGEIQYFATRGWLVLDLNYRGSTGFGRDYMNALRGQWGVADVRDAASAAKYLTDRGLARPDRVVIYGSSAGGYTVLEALAAYPGLFRAGICLYGVSNLFTLAADTHKFEAHYLDSLIGPLPEAAALYRERSPVFHAERIQDHVAVFQGETDEVVPKSQSEAIVESLRKRGVPHEYHVYAGEGHGWRRPETIESYYNSVDKFLKMHVLFA